MHDLQPTDAEAITATTRWLERIVIGLNLCPFAKAVHSKQQIRTVVVRTAPNDTDTVADALCEELALLARTPADDIETTLLIVLGALDNFADYNEFLGVADAILDGLGYAGELQIASFHPHYQFADTAADDITNFTNRSPFPLLHLLREERIARAVDAFPDPENIYARNMETMRALGEEGFKKRLQTDDEPR